MVAQLVDALALKAGVRKNVRVRIPVGERDIASRVGVGTRVLGTDEMTGSTPVASSK